MTLTLSAKEQPLAKIFSDDYVFSIPSYQRPYSWGEEQAQELLDDLLGYMRDQGESIADAAPYFLGSIVLIKRENERDAKVVDGQQRLTTLTLLLSAIRATVGNAQVQAGITKCIYEQGDIVFGTQARYRLSLRERDRDFFRDYVQHEDGIAKLCASTQALPSPQEKLRQNAKCFMTALEKITPTELTRLVQFVITRCYLVAVATQDLDSAYRIFGVLNSRGLDLTATDILKAEIIGRINEAEREKYTEIWDDLEEQLGRDHYGDLFAHIRQIYRKTKPKGTLLKEFRDHVGPPDATKFIVDVLKPLAEAFDDINNATYSSIAHAEQVNGVLRWLGRIEFKDWLPPALAFYARHRDEPSLMLSFFRDLERLAFSILVRKLAPHERIDRFGRLTDAIEKGLDLATESPLQLSPAEQYETYEALSGPLYETHSPRAVALILTRLDGLLSDGSASYDYGVISVEHVMPQTIPPGSQWQTWLPEARDRVHWLDRLGNLALLSRRKNSAAKNYEFEKKKTAYFMRKGTSPFPLTTQVLSEAAWTAEVIAVRQQQLMQTLEKHWRLEKRESPEAAARRLLNEI